MTTDDLSNWKFFDKRRIGLTCVGFSDEQPKEGVDVGPEYVLKAELIQRLKDMESNVVLTDDKIHYYKESFPESDPSIGIVKRALTVGIVNNILTDQVYNHVKTIRIVSQIGEDHSMAIGAITGVIRSVKERLGEDIKVIWVDVHADINTPDTSESGNLHGMPLSFLTDLVEKKIEGLDWIEPCLKLENLVYIGLRDVDENEKAIIKKHKIKAFSMHEIDRYGIGQVMDMAIEHLSKGDGAQSPSHLSFDIDALDPSTGTPVRGGLKFLGGHYIREILHATWRLPGLVIVEVKPSIDANYEDSVAITCSIIRATMSSEHPAATGQKLSNPDTAIVSVPIEGIIAEEEENTIKECSLSDDTVKPPPPPPTNVRINMETSNQPRKMHPLNAFFRKTVPDFVNCQQMWLLIHIILTAVLCGIYFADQMHFSAGSVAIVELLLGVLVRNEIFISFLHCVIAWVPICKYEFNRMLHCIGGLHISCAAAAFFWLLVSLSCEHHGLVVRITGAIILFLIIFLSLTALSIVRRRFHNTFEHIHRYVGWGCLILLIVHVVFLQLDKFKSFHANAIFNLPVLVLVAIVIIIFLPWICVRKVFAQFQQPSNDLTIITFPRALYPYGSTTRISRDRHEWHAFAIALTDAYADQHSVLVAVAGDWTKSLAEDCRSNKLPEHIWIRQIKGIGFMYTIHAYRKVLIVCTGSGIAPALPYIKDPLPTTHAHLLWIAKQHEHNYGEYIWQLVKKTAPHFTLHDTKVDGRPGPQLVEDHFWRVNAEAVFVVSNEKFTKEVVNALWRKGIACFGALFDS